MSIYLLCTKCPPILNTSVLSSSSQDISQIIVGVGCSTAKFSDPPYRSPPNVPSLGVVHSVRLSSKNLSRLLTLGMC